MKIKEHDVYSFSYNEESLSNMFMPYHCFDGTLIVKKNANNDLILRDTYWSSSESRMFTLKDALKRGSLKLLCNLNEVDEIKEYESVYYDDNDVIHLRIHAGYRDRWFLKKEAQRSQVKMTQFVTDKIESELSKIRYAESTIEHLKEKLLKIESGDLSVYL